MDRSIEKAFYLLGEWIEGQGFTGWDPFDALNSPLLKKLTLGNRRAGQLWVQLLKRCPINFRPILGIKKEYNPKAMGLFLGSYVRKYLLDGNPKDLQFVTFFVNWLANNISPGYSGACWGYNFDWPNRGFFAPAGTPTIVNTAFIGLALLDLVDLPGSNDAFGKDIKCKALEIAKGACNFIITDLNCNNKKEDEKCFSYTPIDNRFVHNANVLGALLLARVWVKTNNEEFRHAAQAAAIYTVNHQRIDGSWLYAEESNYHWVDNFHTGFILVALKGIQNALQIQEFDPKIRKGYEYWKKTYFLQDGTPRYFSDRTYPIDIHNVSQAILTYLAFREMDKDAFIEAQKTATWALNNMRSTDGYFYYQKRLFYTNRIPYMRWSQAWMLRAFIELEWISRSENLD